MVVENLRRWDGSLGSGKLDWNRCDFKCRRNVERVGEERTLAGRLFQMVGAAVRKPRVPNDKVHRVTDNRLAEADRKVFRPTGATRCTDSRQTWQGRRACGYAWLCKHYTLDQNMNEVFWMRTTSSIIMQSLGKMVLRAPAVGAKCGVCVLFLFLVTLRVGITVRSRGA